MHEPRRYVVTEARVRVQAAFVSDFSVRRHLGTSFLPSPVLSVPDKFPANAVLPVLGIDEPAFEITYVIRMAVFNKWPDAGFEEADQIAIAAVGHEDELRFGMAENIHHLGAMIVIVVLVP